MQACWSRGPGGNGPQTLEDQLTLFQEGGRLCPPHYCLPTRIFRPSYCPELYAQCTYIHVAVRFGTQLIVAVALTLRMCILRDGQT